MRGTTRSHNQFGLAALPQKPWKGIETKPGDGQARDAAGSAQSEHTIGTRNQIAIRESRMFKHLASVVVAGAVLALVGCTGIAIAPSVAGANISLVAQSTPSKTASIQSFRLQVVSAVLNPGNVQLVTAPVTIDLAQIATGSALLSSVTADEGTYSSMTVEFANPVIAITNTTGNALTIPGGSCAAQSTCTFVPSMKNSKFTITTGVFPLTASSDKAESFALTMAEGKILQADDSLDFNNGVESGSDQPGGSGIGSDGGNEPLDTEVGIVKSVSAGGIVLVSENNDASPPIITDANTIYNFPASVCANNAACVTTGEIVAAALSLTVAGAVHADSISYADAANAKLVEGTITSVASGSNTFQMLVNRSFGLASGTFMEESATTVTVQNGAVFGIGTVGYPAVSGASFTGAGSLLAGQTVLVDVGGSSQLPGVSTSQIFLTDSNTSGTISALANNMTFLLTNYPSEQEDSSPVTSQVMVQAGTSTQYRNLSPASFSSLANDQSVSARGPLFNVSLAPTIAATQVSLHSSTDQ